MRKLSILKCADCRSKKDSKLGRADMFKDDLGRYFIRCRTCGKESARHSSLDQALIEWAGDNYYPDNPEKTEERKQIKEAFRNR